MTPAEFSQRLFQSEPGSPESAALAHEVVEDAHFPARHVIERYLLSTETAEQMKARNVLPELAETALLPLAENPHMRQIEAELWSIRTMTDELVAFRRRAATVLRGQLANRQSLKPPPEGTPGQAPRGSRVCDLAYVLLHRMLHLESPSSSNLLALPAGERDERIRLFQKSRAFRDAFESYS
jgi:hypothetical protein